MIGAVSALAAGGRFGRRAALRGVTSAGAVAAVALTVDRLRGRPMPEPTRVAIAAAFATGAALEVPAAAIPLAAAATWPAVSAVRGGSRAVPTVAAAAAGMGAALLS